MFGWKRRIENRIKNLHDELRDRRNDYWELRTAHERLLNHLGLTETKVAEHTVIEKKSGPEKS